MTNIEKKMLTDTITNVLALTKVTKVLNDKVDEAEREIVRLKNEVLGLQLEGKSRAKRH